MKKLNTFVYLLILVLAFLPIIITPLNAVSAQQGSEING